MANLDLDKLIKETTEQLVKTLTKAEEPLNKADPGKEAPSEKKPEGSSSEGSSDGGQTADSAPSHSEPDGDEGSAPAPDAGSPDGAPAPDAGAPDGGSPDGAPAPDAGSPDGAPVPDAGAGDPATDTGDSVGSLEEQYCALPPNELQVHMTALVSAIGKLLGGTGGMAPPAPAMDAAPAAAAPAPAPAAPPPPAMGKKEFPVGEESGGDVTAGKMAKAVKELEVELQNLKKSIAAKDAEIAKMSDQSKKFDQAAQGLTEILKKTEQGRKAVTSSTFVKSDKTPTITLTKSEIIAKCNALSADPKLAKSDRDAINKYVAGGQPVTVIAHLLAK